MPKIAKTRIIADVNPTDRLWCRLGRHWDIAANFVTRFANRAEPGRSPSYRAYCRDCHRARSGRRTTPLASPAHQAPPRVPLPRDEEVEHALGVLRDARAQREGKQGYVYLIIEVNPGGGLRYGKVGYSTNPQARVAELQTGNPRPLALHLMKPGTPEDETALHQKYIGDNVLQEWFTITKDLLLEWDARHYVKREAA